MTYTEEQVKKLGFVLPTDEEIEAELADVATEMSSLAGFAAGTGCICSTDSFGGGCTGGF